MENQETKLYLYQISDINYTSRTYLDPLRDPIMIRLNLHVNFTQRFSPLRFLFLKLRVPMRILEGLCDLTNQRLPHHTLPALRSNRQQNFDARYSSAPTTPSTPNNRPAIHSLKPSTRA